MKKKNKIVLGFMGLEESVRTDLFETGHSKTPSIEARAGLFIQLPMDECVRLVESVRLIEMDFVLDRIVKLIDGEKFLIRLFINLPPERLWDLMCSTNSFIEKDLFNNLPPEKCITTINIKGEPFFKLSYLKNTKDERAQEIINGIDPHIFKTMMDYSMGGIDDWKKRCRNFVAQIGNVKKITNICSVLTSAQSAEILIAIRDSKIQKEVLKSLPQGHRNQFFIKTKGKQNTLKASQVDVLNLKLPAKKVFLKNIRIINRLNCLLLQRKSK